MITEKRHKSSIITIMTAFMVLLAMVLAVPENADAASKYPPRVTKVSATVKGYDKVTVSWKKVSGADGYKVYRSTAKNGKYTLVKTTTARNFTNTKLKTNKGYYYKVKAYNKVGKKTYLSKKFSSRVYAKPVLKAPTTVKVSATAYNKVKVSWNTGKNAKGYIVYRSTAKNGKYTKVKATTAKSFVDTVKTGTTYYYKVRSYNSRSGKYQYSGYSKIVSVKTKLNKVTGVKASADTEGIEITWKAVPGATKYIVHRDDGVRVTVTGTSYKDTTAEEEAYYQYCVRAVRGTAYGAWSTYTDDITIVVVEEPEEPTTPSDPTDEEEVVTPDTPTEDEEEVVTPSEPTEPTTPSEPTEDEEVVTPSEPIEDGTTEEETTPSTPTEDEEEVVTPTNPTDEEETTSEPGYINYSKDGDSSNATKLYIGQEWSDSLNAALNGGAAVEKLLTRNSKYLDGKDQDVYCFDTEDFDNFLIVYVKENRVIAWQTNAKVLGVYEGVELIQGTPRTEYSQFPEYNPWNGGYSGPYIPAAVVVADNIAIGDIYFGGIVEGHPSWDYTCSEDLVAEELLCEYTVNALRVMNGEPILVHNDYLYGDGATYGAKAWSLTQAASQEMTHGLLTEGPLANIEVTPRTSLVYYASNKTLKSVGENCAQSYGGEYVANGWYTSTGHSQTLMATLDFTDYYTTSIMAAAVAKGDDGLYYWTWCNGNIAIDYGIKIPTVEVTATTDTTATIQWTDVLSEHGDSAYKYMVEVYSDAECTTVYKRAETSLNPYTRKSLEAGTTYYVRVKAGITVDGSIKWGEWSEAVPFTTLGVTE